MSGNQANGVIGFGVFQVDLRAGELRRNGSKVRLQDQPFQVLAVLLENPGEVVTREELRTRLWPADTFVDFDHGLNAAIKRLRDALGDSADNPRFVETLARRGYRFVAPVRGATSGGRQSIPDSILKRKTDRHWRVGLAATAVLVMGTGAGWVAAHHFNPRVEIREQRLTANGPDDPLLSAVISGDGKYLAFADRSGIFLRVIGTGETHAVAPSEGLRAKPASWFPDGSHVLVTAWGGPSDTASLWNISVLGGSPRKLMDNADARSVSPDGSQIAFVRGDSTRQEIWVMSVNGEALRKVAGEPGEYYGPVAWSPDGSHMAFVRYVYKAGHHSGEISVWLLDLGNGQARSILSDPRLGDSLAWTSDGRLIYSLTEALSSPVKLQEAEANLWAVPIDCKTGRPIGEAKQLTSGPDNKTGLSLSADGKHLTFLRWNGQANVYVADIQPGSERLSTPQRLNLDEGRNYPFTWTPDGQSVIFTSDRDGRSHLFKQRVDQPVPDLLVGGTDVVMGARLNPDGSEVLYVVRPEGATGLRLMRLPLAGGVSQPVMPADGIDNFQCARLPSTTCVLGRSFGGSIHFYTFDPVSGKESEFMKAEIGLKYNWSLSPDGSTLALARYRQAQIDLLSMRDGTRRSLNVRDSPGVASLDWAADSQSIWASSWGMSGTQALLNIDLHGRVRVAFSDKDKDVGWAIPSPDGRRVAIWEAGRSANAWMLQGF